MSGICGLYRQTENRGIRQGYWTGYAHTRGIRTLLVEFKSIRSIDPDKIVRFTNAVIAQYPPEQAAEPADALPAVVKNPDWKIA